MNLKHLLQTPFSRMTKPIRLDKEKRTGTIDFQRDKKRAIFHYWWKALLTGITSGTLDMPTKEEKKKEKEKREERRESGSEE
jgi:hypothetical protein